LGVVPLPVARIGGFGNGLPVVEEVDSSPLLLYAAIGTASGAANISRFAILTCTP
jgi:hypothetical protein